MTPARPARPGPLSSGSPSWLMLGILVLAMALPVGAQESPASGALACGPLENPYGPFDYGNAEHRSQRLPVVERHHFDEGVYQLRRGINGVRPAGDIAYTLRAFPNHYRALDAMSRLDLQTKASGRPLGNYSIDCWFERAIRWRPGDGMVYLVYGIHFFRRDNLAQAEEQMTRAVQLMPDSAEAHYNLGLVHVKSGNYSAANEHARKAYELGYPLPGLRNQLVRAGQWQQDIENQAGSGIE